MKKQVVVGFDIDDVLNNSYVDYFDVYIRKYAEENGIDMKVIDENAEVVQLKYDLSKEHIDKFIEEYIEEMESNMEFKENVKIVFDKFKNNEEIDFKIYIVTSRTDKYYDTYTVTKNMFSKNDIHIDKLFINGTCKGKICEENNIEFFVDDRPKYCLDVNNYGVKTFIFDIHYNRKFNNDNIERIYSLEEYYDRVIELVKMEMN